MRMLPIIVASLLFVAVGCSSSSAKLNTPSPGLPAPGKLYFPPDNPFIPGKYTTAEEGKFYTVWDTIIIARISHQQNKFRVSRTTAFQKNTTDTDQTIEQEHTQWFGLYDDVSQALSGINRNIDLRCLPARQQISLLGIVYNRVE